MAVTPPTTDELFEIGTSIDILVIGRKIVQDFRCGMDTFRCEADALFF
jgi:hypothetical protein